MPARKSQTRFWIAVLVAVLSAWKSFGDIAQENTSVIPNSDRLSFDDVGIYQAGYQYRGQAERFFPVGWSGGFEDRTGVAMQPAGEQNGRAAFLLHPPWRGGTGVAFQEFRVKLPPANELQSITLTGATAMRADAMAGPGEKPKSDGATFRIFVDGQSLLDEHRADSEWKAFSLNLTKLAGKEVKIRFETDPGPHDNSAFDFAIWGDRALAFTGYHPQPDTKPASAVSLDLSTLGSIQNIGVVAPSAYDHQTSVEFRGELAVFSYRGSDGAFDYSWARPLTADDPPLGKWSLTATPKGGGRSRTVALAKGAKLDWTKPTTFQSSHWEKTNGVIACVLDYLVENRPAKIRIAPKLLGKSMTIEIQGDEADLAALDVGGWGPAMYRREVTVPYYSGQVQFFQNEQLFANAYLDWTRSCASSLDNTKAAYGADTNGKRVPPHEFAIFTAAWNVDEVLPNIPNPPSPYRDHLAGKIILDIWGGHFEEIAHRLETLHDYGLNNCAIIIHDWQRSGYDNALPAHVPANTNLGGEAAMVQLVATAKRLGYDISLHENYVDYYPNFEGFNTNDLALDSEGHPQHAWYNPGTKIQSFAIQPHAILTLARWQSPQIRDRYQPNADYLDVHSAVPPWFHVDYRAGADGAAQFHTVWDAHRALWSFERGNYHGPVFGEGANHWYWSGYLDGVEAQFGVGWPGSQGRSAPLMVDFDLLKIHPLQVNHGMGYYERWWSTPTWHSRPPMEVLDQYRMQEIAYGHAGFLSGATYFDIPLAWLEHHLVSPVAARYATAKATKIEYQMNGRWVDSSTAAQQGVWQRVRVTYNNGLQIVANSTSEPLVTGGLTLPKFGWSAQGDGLVAWTALSQGQFADYARTEDSTFANARPAGDWNQSGIHHISPAVADFRSVSNRAFEISYQWQINDTLRDDYHCFVHFVPEGRADDISFQGDHNLPRPTSSWKSGESLADGPHMVRLPDGLPDGDYHVRVGLYQPGGSRVSLEGEDDGQDRIETGVIHVRENGQGISFERRSTNAPHPDDIYGHHVNKSDPVLDFGDVRTSGSILVRREGSDWVLRALPRDGHFFIELDSRRFGRPETIESVHGSANVVHPAANRDWWQLELDGATEYRWPQN